MALPNLFQGLCASPLCNPSVHPPLYTCSTIRGSTTCRSVAQRHACTYAYTAYISSRQHLRIPSVHPLCATRPCLACARQPCARQKGIIFLLNIRQPAVCPVAHRGNYNPPRKTKFATTKKLEIVNRPKSVHQKNNRT